MPPLRTGAIRNPVDGFSTRPPHSVSLPKGRETLELSSAGNSGVPSPLGEKDRMRGDSVKQSTVFGMSWLTRYFKLVSVVRSNEALTTKAAPHQSEPSPLGLVDVMLPALNFAV